MKQAHDLREARPADLPEPGQLGVVAYGTVNKGGGITQIKRLPVGVVLRTRQNEFLHQVDGQADQ